MERNHARLFEALQQTRQREQPGGLRRMQHASLQTEEREHGRCDRREYWLVADAEYLSYFAQQVDAWPNLGAVCFVRRQRRGGESEREQVSFFVTSLKQGGRRFARAVRASYWRIENSQT